MTLRDGARWTTVSLLIHVVMLVVLLSLPRPERWDTHVTFVPLVGGQPEPGPITFLVPASPARDQGPGAGGRRREIEPPEPELAVPVVESVPDEPGGRGRLRDVIRDTLPRASELVVGTHRRIGPAYGDGRLWVPPIDVLRLGRPLPGPTGPVAAAPGVESLDRIVTARLMAFLDSLPPDSFAPPPPPTWTTEIAGRTWGTDGRWIYLGGLKLPAALLALLPLPEGGFNYDQGKAAQALQRMREDLLQAARRAETQAEFNRYVAELRKRRQEEREGKIRVARDTIIP